MTKLLVVQTSPRGENSVSRHMAACFVEAWQAAHPRGDVVHRDLVETNLPFVTAPWLQAYFTPPGQQSAEMKRGTSLVRRVGG